MIDNINQQLTQLGLHPLAPDQIECLQDPSRIIEAAGMLDDLCARCGVEIDLPKGEELPTAFDEVEAREEAARLATQFDAVCVQAMATDGRSRDTDEYYVLTFSGPGAGLAAASRPELVALWVDGQEV